LDRQKQLIFLQVKQKARLLRLMFMQLESEDSNDFTRCPWRKEALPAGSRRPESARPTGFDGA
jgi:hypothetical protein